jgi:hypothetical protein
MGYAGRAFVLWTGAQLAQAGMRDGRSRFQAGIDPEPRSPKQPASWSPTATPNAPVRRTKARNQQADCPLPPQKRLSVGQRRAPHTPWPTGPYDHRDKEPRWRAEGAAEGRRPPPQRGGGGRGGNPGRGRGVAEGEVVWLRRGSLAQGSRGRRDELGFLRWRRRWRQARPASFLKSSAACALIMARRPRRRPRRPRRPLPARAARCR